MITAFKLGGLFAAHAIWCVSDGDTLIPMLAFTQENGERQMMRLAFDDLGAAVEDAKHKLNANAMDANDAALLYDGRITIDNRKIDAIIIEMRTYFSPQSEAVIAVPYSPASTGKFRVHKPKILDWKERDDFDMNAALQSFFEGVDSHEKGSKIWNDSLDESI